MARWHADFLPGFEFRVVDLPGAERAPGERDDVPVVATLVRHQPSDRFSGAVLYVHGWNDYFFQAHVAEAFESWGYDFYAVDLRRYGRSLRTGQLNGYITDLDDYRVELDACLDELRERHDRVVVMGHSTGGLVASLWAGRHPDRIDALLLNSPWLDLQGSAMVRALSGPVLEALGTRLPTSDLRLPADAGLYARSIHRTHGGEWEYDVELKRSPSPPIRAGWLRAILQGHARVAAGLDLPMPILVMSSTLTDFRRRWHEDLRRVDTVLDVDQIAQRATRLGRHVTLVRFKGAVHDLLLSAEPVRTEVFAEMQRWLGAYVAAPSALGVEDR